MVEMVHVIGAALTFIGGLIYCVMHTAMSYHMFPNYNGLLICRVRLTITLVALVCLAVSILSQEQPVWLCVDGGGSKETGKVPHLQDGPTVGNTVKLPFSDSLI